MKNFAENLKRIRKANGFSQAKIASLLGVTQQRYAKWELGHSEPSLEMLLKISDTFGVSLDELVRGKTEDPERELVNLITERLRYYLLNCDDRREIARIRKIINELTER